MRKLLLLVAFIGSNVLWANQPRAVLPFKIVNEHIYFELKINESESLQFIFDTGAAANLLNSDTAEKLGIESNGRTSVRGASGSTSIRRSTGHQIDVGGIELGNVAFLLMNIDHLQDEDTPLDGIIGAALLNLFITEINYDDHEIRLYDKDTYKAPENWQTEKFSLRSFNIPVIHASITLPSGKTIDGDYLVDTGAATSVKFNTPFVNQQRLVEAFGPNYEYTSRALSAEAVDKISRITAYTVFGHRFENFTGRLSRGKKGVSSLKSVQGILGLSILKRFNVIYDYGKEVMYLQRSQYYESPFLANHSGMVIEKSNGLFKVEKVYEGSAAHKAGIQKGDLIRLVDNQNRFTRLDFYRYFQEKSKPVSISLERRGKSLSVTLTPQPMI